MLGHVVCHVLCFQTQYPILSEIMLLTKSTINPTIRRINPTRKQYNPTTRTINPTGKQCNPTNPPSMKCPKNYYLCATLFYQKYLNASTLSPYHVISPIVPCIPNFLFSHADCFCSLPHGVKLSGLHVFQRNHQHYPIRLQGLKAELGFQVFDM